MIYFKISLKLNRYIYIIYRYLKNYKFKDKFIDGNQKNEELKSIKKLLSNQYTFYNIYH